MKLSYAWLNEWLELQVPLPDFADQLTMAGIEVESITPVAPVFSKVVVGEVLSVATLPQAEKLTLCQVAVGSGKSLSIVCGASNVCAGIKVPVALIGAELPGGKKIADTQIRSTQSSGLLCSEQDLGMATSSDGLWILPVEAPVGEDLRTYLELDDSVIEVSLTPNRGDCLSILGLAREAAVVLRCKLKAPKIAEVPSSHNECYSIVVQAPVACPRYISRIVKNINPKANTPIWMQERLRRSGMRSLGPLVDVTNYVLLELGQPLHAFDLETLHGALQVRWAKPLEKIHLLDGKTLELDPEVLVIADDQNLLALAGILGGVGSGVTDKTRHVLLECAFFSPSAIAGRARRFGLQTESSYRFERGVDAKLPLRAINRVTELLLQIAGGSAGPVVEVASQAHIPKRATIPLRSERLSRVLGATIADREVTDILKRLGMEVSVSRPQGFQIKPPSYRFDLAIEEDLIEEIARIYGYDQIPMRMPTSRLSMGPVSERVTPLDRAKDLLVARGYQEVITYSFVALKDLQLLNPQQLPLQLSNPISSALAVMRTTLWAGLLQAAKYNLHRQQSRLCLFEAGLTFISQGSELIQQTQLAGVRCGSVWPQQWGSTTRRVDYFDLKADVEAILALAGSVGEFSFEARSHLGLHPGQSAAILKAGQVLGWIGTLHPEISIKQDLTEEMVVFELNWEVVQKTLVPEYRALSMYPSVRRDLAIVVDEKVHTDSICKAIRSVLTPQVNEIIIFDIYRGEGVASGRKSIALGLILQESSRTLVDQEVEAAVTRVVAALKHEFGADLRE